MVLINMLCLQVLGLLVLVSSSSVMIWPTASFSRIKKILLTNDHVYIHVTFNRLGCHSDNDVGHIRNILNAQMISVADGFTLG